MKLKNGDISRLYEALTRLSGLTGKEGLAVAKTKLAIRDDAAAFVEVRDNIFRRYGTEEAGRLVVHLDSPNYEDFLKEITELANEEVDADLHQIPEAEYNIDRIYCETAQAEDYEVFDRLMVDRTKVDSDEPV